MSENTPKPCSVKDQRLVTIVDPTFAPALELIRYLLDPKSPSAPVIPIGLPRTRLRQSAPSLFDSERISWLQITDVKAAPAAESYKSTEVGYLSLSCASEALERIAYLPADSPLEFEIPLYCGHPSKLVEKTYAYMRDFDWRILLRVTGVVMSVEALERPASGFHELSQDAQKLMEHLQDVGRVEDTETMSDENRLKFVKSILRDINSRGVDTVAAGTIGRVGHLTDQSTDGDLISAVITPPEIARDMVWAGLASLNGKKPIRFGDPAAGRGRFFAALSGQYDNMVESAIGYELNTRLCGQAQALWGGHGFDTREVDFMTADLHPDRDLIVANPPYRRSQELSRTATLAWSENLEKILEIRVSGRSDLYIYFLLKAHSWLAPDGVAVWLVPSEFRFTEYGKELRNYLLTRVDLLQVHAYDTTHSVFEDARVTSTVLVFAKRSPETTGSVQFTFGGSLVDPCESVKLRRDDLLSRDRWPQTPHITTAPNGDFVTIGELFHTRRGIATGANGVFVIGEEKRQELDIPLSFLKPVLPRSRYLPGPIIYSHQNGCPVVQRPQWLIDFPGPIELIKTEHPRFYDYLLRAKLEFGRRRLIAARKDFTRQEQRPHAPFLFGYMSRGTSTLPFYLNRSRATFLNNYIGLYPRYDPEAADRLGIDEVQILSMLRETRHDQVLEQGRVYSTGLRKIEPRELGSLRLKDKNRTASLLVEHCMKGGQ